MHDSHECIIKSLDMMSPLLLTVSGGHLWYYSKIGMDGWMNIFSGSHDQELNLSKEGEPLLDYHRPHPISTFSLCIYDNC